MLPHLEQLRAAAAIGTAPAALYPLLARPMGALAATSTMSRDHVAVERLTAELGTLRSRLQAGEPDPALDRDLRRVLYGLHTLIAVHFAKGRRSTCHCSVRDWTPGKPPRCSRR